MIRVTRFEANKDKSSQTSCRLEALDELVQFKASNTDTLIK
jgi:hypothetical protein